MREIKFRAWHKNFNIMSKPIEMFSIFPFEIDLQFENKDLPGGEFTVKKGDIIWLQYTGLKDKNGKEIYEGDIIEYPFDHGDGEELEREEIIFEDGGFEPICSLLEPDLMEVVGNIYDNTELLN